MTLYYKVIKIYAFPEKTPEKNSDYLDNCRHSNYRQHDNALFAGVVFVTSLRIIKIFSRAPAGSEPVLSTTRALRGLLTNPSRGQPKNPQGF
jgi:hypothetical protein